MNLYLCSTIRHFMLAVLKSLNEPDTQSTILLIVDQQKLQETDFDSSSLPSHIKIRFIHRKKTLASIYSGGTGNILKLAAVVGVRPTAGLQAYTRKKILPQLLGENHTPDFRLYLFNDRNRLARLLKLAVAQYSVIEDGLSNYYGVPLSILDQVKKLFSGSKRSLRYIGDSNRCQEILLLNQDKAPQEIAIKVKGIDFIKPKNVTKYCYPLFKVSECLGQKVETIIATQPISVGNLTETGFDLEIYRNLIQRLNSQHNNFVCKLHPRESIERYQSAFPEVHFIQGKIPLELMIFGSEKKLDILSIYSSAGMGFEKYCTRKTLIHEGEAERMAEVFESWRREHSKLDKRLSSIL
ncbi:glycosyltransferase family 52 [Photobacterium rosenbergii]|uniref:glycosyltransferase family 52 n=1 Tax=Photobacterium rosenbergii TaxID=294936 RepID=UPI001C996BB2|nr:glycosyltransferase family 52 [Photobacterium rosenbergii]MBY5947155.1 glycosyltransferase family 52 protein [Photobacterium rosenbergii]